MNPVTITVSVSPTSIAAYTGTATLSWSSLNANVCEYDETERSVSGRESVGPFSSSGTKSFSVSCTGDGEGSFAEVTADLTVTRAPAPRITTTLSAAVLEAGVDSLTVTWSTQYADYCSAGGNNSYPTGGTANLGTYAAGTHSLSFSCTGDGGTTPHTIRWKAVNRVTVRPSVSPSTIKANDSDTVTVSWNSPDADSCSHDGTDYTNSDSIPFGPYSYSETGTKSATITCRNMLGSASGSVSWTVERDDPDPPPRPPRNLQATPNASTDGRFTLNWDAPLGGTTATGYLVYLRGSSSRPLAKTFAARTLSFTDIADGTYTHDVKACSGTNSAPVCGAAVSVTVTVSHSNPPPPPPRNLRATPNPSTDGRFTLSWDAPLGGTTAIGYLVYLRGSSSRPLAKTFAARTLSFTDIADGTYTYDVKACSGTKSAPVCGTAVSVTVTVNRPNPPPAPENLRATPNPSTDGSVELSWDAPLGGTTAIGYLVYLQGSSSSPLAKPFADRTLSLSGLADGAHTYEVKACSGREAAPNCGTAATVMVTVNIVPPIVGPTITASLSRATVTPHVGETLLTWSSTNASSCRLNDETPLLASGTLTLGPFNPGSHDIIVTCEDSSGVQASETLTVTARAPPTAGCSGIPVAPATAEGLSRGPYIYVVTGSSSGSIRGGPERYTPDSAIATAAVHAGFVEAGQRAAVILDYGDGQSSYDSVTANGITSASHGATSNSYQLTLVGICGGTEAAPDAPENLLATPNPSADGNFELTWDAPSSGTSTTPAGYLVYLKGSTSGPLIKTFSASSLSQSGLDNGSYVYQVFACANTESNPNCGTVASLTVTVEIPDADGDGIPDAQDPDDDNDGMSDLWELGTGLDPTNSADARLDDDNDGYNNLAEFNAGTDPNWVDSHPGSIPAVSFGFNDRFIVEKGLIDGDALEDMLIRDPTPGILPGISDFVLIKNSEGGFDLQDADGYTITNRLTDITSIAEVADLNGDGSLDLILTGLKDHFPGSNDRIVYGNTDQKYTIPQAHTNIPGMMTKFFHDLSGWIDNANYFEDNLPTVPRIVSHSFLLNAEGDIITGENSDETQTRAAGAVGDCLEGDLLCAALSQVTCVGFDISCDHFTGDRDDIDELPIVQVPSGDRNIIYGQWAVNPCLSGKFNCNQGSVENVVSIRDAVDDPDQPNVTVGIRTVFNADELVTVRDFSVYNPDAYALFRDYLPAIRSSGAVQPGSEAALMIAGTLEAYLGTTVFEGGLVSWGSDTLPGIEDHSSFSGVVGDMLNVIGNFREAMPQRVGYREAITLDERRTSGYWDLLATMPDCTFWEKSTCTKFDFSMREQRAIKSKLDELFSELTGRTYESADAAARALHDSEVNKLAYLLNIEVGAIIDDTTSTVRIEDSLFTDFESRRVGIPAVGQGKSIWHNHPSGSNIWWRDAVEYTINNLNIVCGEGNSAATYASGDNLSKASVRQVLNRSIMMGNVPFDYQVDVGSVWQNESSQYDFDLTTNPDFRGYDEYVSQLRCTN